MLLALPGCASAPLTDPVGWWHQLEGGPIADARPPPPNADAPYPSLGAVPAKPPAPDAAAHAGLAQGLAADRANAHYAAQVAPLAAPLATPGAAAPRRPTPPPALPAAAADEQPNASMAAAEAAPAPPPKPAAKLPVKPAAAPSAAPSEPRPADTPMPPIPDAPPPAPQLSGLTLATTGAATVAAPAATAPPPAPPPPPPPLPPNAIAFPSGSAVLPPEASAVLKSLVSQRGAAAVSITGFGEAASNDPPAQAAALPLGYARARAVAAALLARGVPATSLRIEAVAPGNGAVARIVN